MSFAAIIGHQRQKDILCRLLASSRLAHAYLFSGPEGVGKRLMALALIRAIFCEQQGCGTCPDCRRVDHYNHPDLHLLEADGSAIKIEQVRALQRELSYRPLEAPRKACIIEAAEKMQPAAANALLKTLEEPPGSALFILLSSQPQQLLSTIRSRCQLLPFSSLPTAVLRQELMRRLDLDEAQGHLLAALSEGSFKKALGQDRELFLHERKSFLKAVTSLSAASIVPLLDLARKLSEDKERLPGYLEILLAFFRDLLLFRQGRATDEMVNVDLLDKVQRCAQRETTVSLLTKIEAIEAALFHLRRNVNRELAMDVLLLRLCA